MDGKQSVRTGSSSPLGELLDHGITFWKFEDNISGCDSLCVSLLNIVIASAMRIGPNYSLFAVVVGIIAFYLPHWQELHANIDISYSLDILRIIWNWDTSMDQLNLNVQWLQCLQLRDLWVCKGKVF